MKGIIRSAVTGLALAIGCGACCGLGEAKRTVTVAEKTGAAIQRAIDEVAAAGGGRVVVPAGEYPSGSLRMRSHVELHLEKGATVVGGDRSEDYFSFPVSVCAVRPEGSARVFVYAWDAEDIAITGEGAFEGQGPKFFDHSTLKGNARFWAKPACERPRMVQFVKCRGIRLEGVTFKDSPGWTMLIRLCEDIDVDGIRVVADQRIINSDGIDFDSCRHVRVTRSEFRTGDDCLIMRAMREAGSDEHMVCEDVLVSDCTLDSACQTIRMGCPSDDEIRNVTFRNIRARGWNGIYFDYPARYLRPTDDGYMNIHDIVFDGYTGDFKGSAMQIVVEPGVKIRGARDIVFRNFDVRTAKPPRFVGNVHSAIERVRYENVTVNGVRQPDGDVAADCTSAGPLVRPRRLSWETANQTKGKAAAKRVKVSDFGYDPVDATAIIRKALDSGAKTVVFDRQKGPWYTESISLGSHVELVFEEGVELVAKKGGFVDTWASLFDIINSTDVVLRGEGKGATLRMLREDYINEPYRPSEHRHGINILSAQRVTIENLRIVASGGDGIYLGESWSKGICKEGEPGENGPCRDVVIRKCDCDLNHRQGISVISAENLLIEDTVLRNTLGTAPRAGIDFEPNFDGNRLVNCVMRNCLVENNKGAGYEFYLANQGASSAPISVRIENCRSVGNSSAVSIGGGGRETPFAKGCVSFSNCSFESPRVNGISIGAKPADAYLVKFENCVVSNAANAVVSFSTRKPSQGPVDNVDFGNLRAYGHDGRAWFAKRGLAFGPPPRNVRGTVTLVAKDGSEKQVRLDPAWAAANMPAFQDGELPPPRALVPDAGTVRIDDTCPGQLVSLAPVTATRKPRYVFFAEKGRVRFVARRIVGKSMADPPVKPFEVRRLDASGYVGEPIRMDLPGIASKEFAFDVPERGFYAIVLPRMRGLLYIEKSSVPMALDATQQQCTLKPVDGKPMSLSFASSGAAFEVLAIGNSYDNFRFRLVDPSGKSVVDRETGDGAVPVRQACGHAAGYWKVELGKGRKPHYATAFVDVFGTGGFLFLSPEKRWR